MIGEWSQTLFFLHAGVISFMIFRIGKQYCWFFLLLGLCCLFVVMEEISWGQRLFSIETPGFFIQHNQQHELNIHNFFSGPKKTQSKTALEYLISIALVVYGGIYPILNHLNYKYRRFLQKFAIPCPPITLIPYFLTAAILEPEPFSFNEAEIAELFVSIALSFLALHYLFVARYNLLSTNVRTWDGTIRKNYSRTGLEIISITPLIALLITGVLYETSDIGHITDRRLHNGYKKFAKRYQTYEDWHSANELLLKVYQNTPKDTSNLNNIAVNYYRMGEIEKYRQFHLQAKAAKNSSYPKEIIRTYRQAEYYRKKGDEEKTLFFADKAYNMALANAKKKLKSAQRAYWLAKTMQINGMKEQALLQFKKAHILAPHSSRYRQAYYEAKKTTIE